MLRNSTIWESAGRPLFVRSVWLETPSARVVHQRHFILDYESRMQPERALKSASGTERVCDRRGSLEALSCSDSSYWLDAQEVLDCSEQLPLIGSAKLKLHQPTVPQQIKQQQKLHRHYRRPTFSHKRVPQLARRFNDLHDMLSRHSSLQDLPSCLSNVGSNPDERLAERVLNWLDLAGKSNFVRAHEQACELMNGMKARRAHGATQAAAKAPPQRSATTARTPGQRRRSTQPKGDARSHMHAPPHCKLRDSVKHISIIFNRQGVPVRFNRPARNIDLCALTASASTTRRLAGALASARLYRSADCAATAAVGSAAAANKRTPRTPQHSRARHSMAAACSEEPLTSMLQQRLREEAPCHDAKKELHIFMPSLPKKGFLTAGIFANGSTLTAEDSASLLSNTFSELCQV